MIQMQKFSSFKKILLLQLSMMVIFSFILTGCGKKAPPVPPQQVASVSLFSLEKLPHCGGAEIIGYA
jgi:predicted small lipoprotein YifL